MGTNLVHHVESTNWIDRAADPLQSTVASALDRAPAVGDALQGRWLGHPLHAALTDVPVGAWTSGLVLDILSSTSWRNRILRPAADAVHALGLVAALGAAVTGLADWSRYARSSGKRLGFVHGATNVVIAGLFGGSLIARSQRARTTGVALAATGFGLLLVSTWLGGELTYRLGVHVGREEPKVEPRELATDSPTQHIPA